MIAVFRSAWLCLGNNGLKFGKFVGNS